MELNNYFDDVIRNSDFDVLGIIDSSVNLPTLSFIESEEYIDKLLSKTNITCVIATQKIANILFKKSNLGIAVVQNPRLSFFEFHNILANNKNYCRKNFKTIIGKNCQISKMSCISEKNVIIGDNVTIEEFVSIKENTIIDDNSIIRVGSVIGSSGFEYKRTEDRIMSVYHLGGVKIGKCVEIKCNTVVDKAIYPWDSTIIDDYTKIDNLVHIGHAVKIGKRVMIPAMCVIGGRVIIKDNSWIGIGSVLRNAIQIGKCARVNMGSVVTRSVEDNHAVSGNWAIDHKDFIKLMKSNAKKLNEGESNEY